MKPTIAYIREKFDQFNLRYFDGSLPEIPIRLSHARTFLGAVRFMRHRNMWGREVLSDFILVISVHYDLPESEVEDTIIHEMIHYYIYVNGIKDTSAHGRVFKKMMNDINRRDGRHVSVSRRREAETDGSEGTPLETEDRSPCKYRILMLTELADGQFGITVCARTRVFELIDNIPKYYKVKNIEIYISFNPFFERYPNSIKPRIYRISEAERREYLSEAVRMRIVRDKHGRSLIADHQPPQP